MEVEIEEFKMEAWGDEMVDREILKEEDGMLSIPVAGEHVIGKSFLTPLWGYRGQ